jgi:hypothetical protein
MCNDSDLRNACTCKRKILAMIDSRSDLRVSE